MILLELFISFVKIGFTSFGGMSMIPLISSEMLTHGWMIPREIADIVAIAEMTPGPLGLNCATFCGIRTAGLAGAVVANLGMLSPTFTLCALAAVFMERFRSNTLMGRLLTGIRPACIGLILGIILSLARTNYLTDSGVSLPSVFIGAVDLFLLLRAKLSIPKVIGVSAVLGILFFGLLGL